VQLMKHEKQSAVHTFHCNIHTYPLILNQKKTALELQLKSNTRKPQIKNSWCDCNVEKYLWPVNIRFFFKRILAETWNWLLTQCHSTVTTGHYRCYLPEVTSAVMRTRMFIITEFHRF